MSPRHVGFALGHSGQTEHIVVREPSGREHVACGSKKVQETERWSRNGVSYLCKRCVAWCHARQLEVVEPRP